MSPAPRKPREALETVWLARCPSDCPGFEGLYVFAFPDPPRLERTGKKFLVWNYGSVFLIPQIYHRLFKGLRLHPSEGPRRVSLRIERAQYGPWVGRYDSGKHRRSGHYVFGTNPNTTLTKLRSGLPCWSDHLFTLSGPTLIDIFSGLRLPHDTAPMTVSITATAVD